jgi:hypothetical protein
MKQEAWGGNSILTPRGKEEYKATFTNLNPSHFLLHLHDKDDHWQLRVFRQNVAGRQEQIVKLPKNPMNGSYFGRCTCGAGKTDAVPCEHMAAIAQIPDFSLRLCPDWTEANKSGCPKKGKHYKLGLEKAMATGKPGAKKGVSNKEAEVPGVRKVWGRQ